MINGPFRLLLFPLSLIYGLIIRIRNWLYNSDILKSEKFDIPVISIGNLAVGGTGKTPHIEDLVRRYKRNYEIAVLSRGYKRKSSGFIIADVSSGASEVGDEPAQVKRKFPDIVVAVDTDRRNGIKKILETHPEINLILLDDAFQHRKVSPGLCILISDYNKRYTGDFLLPYGWLREHRKNSRRADILIISRSPLDLSQATRETVEDELNILSHQNLFFTSTVYKEPIPLFPETPEPLCLSKIAETNREILLITGMASPGYLYNYLSVYSKRILHLEYPDHHRFTRENIKKIKSSYDTLSADNRCIITSEKDAVRLMEIVDITDFPDMGIYYIPIGISFLNDDAEKFNKLITEYAGKDKSNSNLSKG